MTDHLINSTNILLDFEEVPTQAIALEPERIEQAVQLSSQIPNETQQWQTYLNALALFGFEQWLNERAQDLPLNREECSIFQLRYANAIAAVFNLKVGSFKLCLIAIGSLTDEEVTVPRAVIDLPEFIAHFYVLLEIQEEQEQAVIRGFLRYDELVNQQQAMHLQADRDWTYRLPLAWFESDPDSLLLYLRCLDPKVISLPKVPVNRPATLSSLQVELTAVLPKLQSPDYLLWQVLTWEQGVAILTNPELLEQLVSIPDRHSDDVLLKIPHTENVLQQQDKLAVNVGLWLRDKLDEFTQSLGWILLPAPAPATPSLRSLSVAAEDFEAISAVLKDTGMEIPPHARGAYRDLKLAEIPLRLYAVTWCLSQQGNIPEWKLLLVLGAQPGTLLPHGIKLRVSDQKSVLVEQVLEQNTDDTYLYTGVVGTWDEKFLVAIALMNGEALTLPPFAFLPEQPL